jgi:hypothetical protein
MKNVIWTTLYCDNLLDNQIIQINLGRGTKIKAIEKESRNTMWVWEKKLSQTLSKNGCLNIISQLKIPSFQNCVILVLVK